jgi:HD-like signal output (HDOD) protein
MNWFTKYADQAKKLFSHSREDSSNEDVQNTLQETAHQEMAGTGCNPPSRIFNKRLNNETLKKFIPLRSLEKQYLDIIPHNTLVYDAKAVLFLQNQISEKVYYLLEGQVELFPLSDGSYVISSDDVRARMPLNSSSICGATAVAMTEVKILALSINLNQLWSKQSDLEIDCIELMDLHLPEEINDLSFFNSFAQAYREHRLSLPSLPNVAIKLNDAMQHDIGVKEVVDIIQIDAPVVTKLIQVANSPIYSPASPITNCNDAVVRLGLDATKTLVMSISMKQLFKCQDRKLYKMMQQLWKNSLYVSSLAFVLAAESGKVKPEDALLAGLVADIGVIPLLHFAEENPKFFSEFGDLEKAMPYLKAPVGTLVLHTLGFNEDLSAIPHHAEDWFYDTGPDLTLTDIVILAKLHSYVSLKQNQKRPYINSIPAYAKIKDGNLTPDFSLQLLTQARLRIKDVMMMIN